MHFRKPGYHGLWPNFPDGFANALYPTTGSRYPEETSLLGLACSAFARHY